MVVVGEVGGAVVAGIVVGVFEVVTAAGLVDAAPPAVVGADELMSARVSGPKKPVVGRLWAD